MSFIKNIFKKENIDLKLVDTSFAGVWKHYPPVLAKDLRALKEYQTKKYGEYKLVTCPGMHDYSRIGYILPAWDKMVFKSNKAGSVAFIGSQNPSRGTAHEQPKPMSTDLTDGMFTYYDGVMPNAWNFPSPWKIIGAKNLSAIVMPAIYHNKTLNDDIYVYPGLVDYHGFHPINLICSVRRKGEFTIQEGEPLLHIIPFKVSKDINAEYGLATREENTETLNGKYFHTDSFYRKYFLIKKKFKLSLRKLNE